MIEKAQLEALLGRLDADAETAALRYEELRQRLIRYFRWERSGEAEDLADEVLNRVARKLADGEAIEVVERYAAGVARMLLRESLTRIQRRDVALKKMVVPEPVDREALAGLDACLAELQPEQAKLILRYYAGQGSAHIAVRNQMAMELGLELNALRNRALRIRERLEACVQRRLGKLRDKSMNRDTSI
ncbi:MAG: hypothetical protein FJW36_16135 [Acidobacteria bacterium]|nr:hypothetical protein [Acidobacteriota bacterium]